jgi:hypothetical protein
MNIRFVWEIDEWRGKNLLPVIQPDDYSEIDPRKYLGFLNDDGGMQHDVYIPHFIDLRDAIRGSKYDDSVDKSFCTESWCAEVKGDVTNIYFAYDETYGENMDTDLFYKVLCEWIDFVQQGPGQEGEPPVRKFTV